jgi:transcriptional repressor NrdR
MNCPYCNKEETSVLESRVLSSGDGIRRRRKCLKCNKRFTTHERVVNIDLKVVKKNGKIEQYDRDKLMKGVVKACYKRNVRIERLEEVVDKIEGKLLNRKTTEVKSCEIGKMVLVNLKKIDNLAYLRFASVYMDFSGFTDFKKFVNEIIIN